MSARRVMGAEVEYGISVLGEPRANPIASSSLLVNAYARGIHEERRPQWDYAQESPLRDARGHDLPRHEAHPSQLTDDDSLVNVILSNGARLYVDHAHPEFSTPEVTNPLDVVRWDRAGEVVMRRAAARVQQGGGPEILLHKNNTDNKGVSYGAHENYLMSRATPFPRIVRDLVPFFVSRQIMCGAGRVGLGRHGQEPGFQISQRADFFEVEVGLETTVRRPIINTRDEPHADASRHRRLHVIVGDANLSETATFVKFGATALVLSMVEADVLPPDLTLAYPVQELRDVSRDPLLRHRVTLKDGRRMTALDLQQIYLEKATAHVRGTGAIEEPETGDVLRVWAELLNDLGTDPALCADRLDWVAKWTLLERYRDRDGLAWDASKLQLVDLQYADLRPGRGLHQRLVQSGRMQTLVAAEAVEEAVNTPPHDTRAYFRGTCMSRFPDSVAAASWDSVIFDLPGQTSLKRVPMPDPLRGSEAHLGELFARCDTAGELFDALTAPDR